MELVTRREAAKYLKMSPATLALWDRKHPQRLRAIKMENGRIRYDMDRIREFVGAGDTVEEEQIVS